MYWLIHTGALHTCTIVQHTWINMMKELMNYQIYILHVKREGSAKGVYVPVLTHDSFVRRWQSGKDMGNYSTFLGVRTWYVQSKVIRAVNVLYIVICDTHVSTVCLTVMCRHMPMSVLFVLQLCIVICNTCVCTICLTVIRQHMWCPYLYHLADNYVSTYVIPVSVLFGWQLHVNICDAHVCTFWLTVMCQHMWCRCLYCLADSYLSTYVMPIHVLFGWQLCVNIWCLCLYCLADSYV